MGNNGVRGRILSVGMLFFLVGLMNALTVYGGTATLAWDPPTTNVDGTPLVDLAGYKIYYGTVSGNYTNTVDIGNRTTHQIANLTDSITYYFAVTAYNIYGSESGYSIQVSKTIPSALQYNLTASKTGTGAGTVTSSPAGIACGTVCSGTYAGGTIVTLTAAPDIASTFGGWTGACTGTGACSVTMDTAKTVTTSFALKTYAISATAGTGGSITPSGSVSVNQGASQTFTITPNAGYMLSSVLVDGVSVGAVSIYTFTNVTTNHTISASFAAISYGLTVTKTGSGTGTVSSTPAGISCGSTCSATYAGGTIVTLTASPDASSTFGGWTGTCTGIGACSVTLNAAKTVSAVFTLKTYTITATAGSGGTIAPAGALTVNHGSNGTFTITPNAGYMLSNVLVDGVSAGAVNTYTFTG
ncbi:MAG TPA: fibronectin type III domain-containing protein, partial [Nitrospirota bacterium]|nr:fibronectin type III domain-containing protein [Nitrospirota bacterium]